MCGAMMACYLKSLLPDTAIHRPKVCITNAEKPSRYHAAFFIPVGFDALKGIEAAHAKKKILIA